MDGFKTCANVDKAKAEGAFTLYSTDPEQGQVKLLAAFNKMFPEIKTSYVRLQAGALYAKVLSERQAKSYLVDVIQISDMGMILDFQRRGGFRQYVSPQMADFKKEYKSKPEGFWTWGSIIMAGIAYNPNNVSAAEAPKKWEDLLDPKWKDAINVKVSNSGLQHGVWYVLKPILGLEYFKKFGENKPRAFDSYVQQYGRLVDGQDKIIMGAQYSGYIEFKAKGAPLAFVFPETGVPAVSETYGIVPGRPASQRRRAVHGLVPRSRRPAGAFRRAAAAFAAHRRAGAGRQRAAQGHEAAVPGRLERLREGSSGLRQGMGPHRRRAALSLSWRR